MYLKSSWHFPLTLFTQPGCTSSWAMAPFPLRKAEIYGRRARGRLPCHRQSVALPRLEETALFGLLSGTSYLKIFRCRPLTLLHAPAKGHRQYSPVFWSSPWPVLYTAYIFCKSYSGFDAGFQTLNLSDFFSTQYESSLQRKKNKIKHTRHFPY